MALKPIGIRLTEDEYNKLKELLSEHGDPELNVGYVIRAYIRDLIKAIPHLKRSDVSLRKNIEFF